MSLNHEEKPQAPEAPQTLPRPRSVSTTLAVIVVILVAAATIGATAAYYTLRPVPHPSGPGTVTVYDDLGRSVTAPVNAAHIVVLAPSVMDIVYRLGLRSHVVAVGCTVSFPGGILNEYSPNQTALWSLTNSSCITDFPGVNTEAVANATPGLVLATTLTSQGDVSTLANTYHLPVVILTPSTLAGVIDDVRIVAELFPSAQSTASTLESELSRTITQVSSEAANLTAAGVATPSVLLTYYFDPGGYYTYGPGSFGDSTLSLVGGTNVADAVLLQYGEMNATAVLNDQPNVVLYGTSWNDAYLVAGETPSVWSSAPYWSQLTGSHVAVDVTLVSEPDPSMVLALPWIQHALYPSHVPP
ncbi:MAG: ABC transporter substrate-binding protein [Euryarchaeota archaeon]|nr:ABC transporter substrate-binding protein [Euryarchaeota archaeon]